MKKIFLGVLSIALIAGTMTSCGKTTTGKMSEEWKVTSIESTSSSTNNGTTTTSSSKTTISGTSLTQTSVSGSNTTTSAAVANVYTYNIKKDGTFELNTDVTVSQTGYSQKRVNKQTGTWSFVGTNKTDSFKKNERVVFNTLTSTSTTTNTSGNVSSTSSDSDSWKVGENSAIYTVKESTSKKLVLAQENNSTSSTTSGSSTSTSASSGTTTITLEK